MAVHDLWGVVRDEPVVLQVRGIDGYDDNPASGDSRELAQTLCDITPVVQREDGQRSVDTRVCQR